MTALAILALRGAPDRAAAGALSSTALTGELATPRTIAHWYKDIPGYHPMWRCGAPTRRTIV